jgi:hypothetical protein
MRDLTSTELDRCAGGVLVTGSQPAGSKFRVGVVEPFDPIGRPLPVQLDDFANGEPTSATTPIG